MMPWDKRGGEELGGTAAAEAPWSATRTAELALEVAVRRVQDPN